MQLIGPKWMQIVYMILDEWNDGLFTKEQVRNKEAVTSFFMGYICSSILQDWFSRAETWAAGVVSVE